ncbi:MAG: M1 family metallopeptidase [Pseudomonadota bacterium]
MRIFLAFLGAVSVVLTGQVGATDAIKQTKGVYEDRFRQLGPDLPTPNVYRTASGAPGPEYWQQRADYKIQVALDEEAKRIDASALITYTNNSPDDLRYLWVQLDQNRFRDTSLARRSETAATSGTRRTRTGAGDSLSYGALARHQAFKDLEYGFEINAVEDGRGGALDYKIVDTMLRIDLSEPLRAGGKAIFSIDWSFNIIEESVIGGRGGYEYFPETDTYQYFLAQWFPRMAAYTDYGGWLNQQFLGRGEFTLEFGDYDVEITVPADHIVASSGVLQNPNDVLTAEQRTRLAEARNADSPVFIVTPEEALDNEKEGTSEMKTWRFRARNVRDFAWASSRKYIWDAMGYEQDDRVNPVVMAMSFYPNEGEPVWSQYSTHAVAHTMDVYSRFSFAYPYPVAISVNSWERGGMEYPMITFNGYRPSEDEKSGERTYSRRLKYGLIGVIIHEIGHIYFPMVVNSDERQWTWMDEGINTFLEYVAELEWEENYPAWRGNKTNVMDYIAEYMKSENQVPIMTQSDAILQFGPNAYSKPAAGLALLRETVMGRELFDHAFREYATRWKFKRPTPSDFFRTMEDASAVDLDWFWRGWFYSTDHVDVGVADVREYKISTLDPDVEMPLVRDETAAREPETLAQIRNREEGRQTRLQRFPELADFYNENDPFTPSNKDRNAYQDTLDGLEDWERAALERAIADDEYVYFVDFVNTGGLVMPLPLEITYESGASERMDIPAEIWRRNHRAATKLIISQEKITSIAIDTRNELPDTNRQDNHFPRRIMSSRLDLYKSDSKDRDLMADMLVELKGAAKDEVEAGGAAPLQPAED